MALFADGGDNGAEHPKRRETLPSVAVATVVTLTWCTRQFGCGKSILTSDAASIFEPAGVRCM
jgi:hypothetical protein